MVAGYIAEVRDILQMFIHQQYTGRALVFVLLLRLHVRESRSGCEKFMEQLSNITGMGVSTFARYCYAETTETADFARL